MARIMQLLHPKTVAAFLLLVPMAQIRADEGFWTFDRIPVQLIESRTGARLSPEWLRHVQQSTLRYNGVGGGSASFVSADGLALTAFHVNRPILEKLRTKERDLVRDGYLARRLDQEVPLPGVSLDALISMTDVTEQVRAMESGTSGTTQVSDDERREKIKQIEQSATSGPSDVAEVVAFFDGGRYVLYRYRRYTDVRLVFSPEYSVVGEPTMDFPWERAYPAPRVDFAFIRAYEHGQPAHPAEYLRWSYTGPVEGSVVYVTGAPTYSRRLGTVAELEFRRDVEFPQGLEMYSRLENALGAWANRSDERRKAAAELLVRASYFRHIFGGTLTTLRNQRFWDGERSREDQIRDELTEQANGAQFGPAASAALNAYAGIEKTLDGNDAVEEFARSHVLPYGEQAGLPPWLVPAIEQDWDFIWSEDLVGPLYSSALALLRSHAEARKPDDSRALGYRDTERPSLRRWLDSFAQINPDIETVRLEVWLENLILKLGADDPITKKALSNASPAARAVELAHGTRLTDQSFRDELLDADATKFDRVTDPMIELLRELEPDIDRINRSYGARIARREAAHRDIVRAMANLRLTAIYPNANRTVRLEYGTVEGYVWDSQLVPAVTGLRKVYEWSEHQYESVPYQLSASWRSARARADFSAPLNFLTSADVLGGNSGSATVDSRGRVIGLVCCAVNVNLDGPADFVFYPWRRDGNVATPGMIEALKRVYGARELLREISQGHL